MICSTSIRWRRVETSSCVTWYGGDFSEKLWNTTASAPPVGSWPCPRCRGGCRRVRSARWPHANECTNETGRRGGLIRGGCSRAANRPGSRRRSRAGCQDYVRARQVEHEFVLGYLAVGIRLHTLGYGGGTIAHACPTARRDIMFWTQRVGKGRVSTVNPKTGEGVVCAENVVGELCRTVAM